METRYITREGVRYRITLKNRFLCLYLVGVKTPEYGYTVEKGYSLKNYDVEEDLKLMKKADDSFNNLLKELGI